MSITKTIRPYMENKTTTTQINNDKLTRSLNRKTIAKGLRYFILLSVAGLTILFFYTSTPETLAALGKLQGKFLFIAVALSAFDLWLGGYRNHIFVRKIKPGVRQSLCIRANIANLFMGAVTPSQSGGGPAQLFILYRGGISLASGVSVSVINFLSTLVYFLLAASFAMFFVQHKFSQQVVQYLIRYGFFAFAFLAVLFAIALWRPDLIGRAIEKIAVLLGKSKTRLGKKVERIGQAVVAELDRYHETCMTFIRKEPHLLPYSFVLTIIMYTNKFILAYFVMRGLGV
ncbi:MAG: YbhN family protein, partial [bacterium]